MAHLHLIDQDQPLDLDCRIDGSDVRLSPDQVRDDLGWDLRDEGLCQGDVCVPIAEGKALAGDAGISLAGLADALGRPLALDLEEGVAVLGTASDARAASLASLEAPDFTLPDLDGVLHSLSEHRGKKVLLIAYASW